MSLMASSASAGCDMSGVRVLFHEGRKSGLLQRPLTSSHGLESLLGGGQELLLKQLTFSDTPSFGTDQTRIGRDQALPEGDKKRVRGQTNLAGSGQNGIVRLHPTYLLQTTGLLNPLVVILHAPTTPVDLERGLVQFLRQEPEIRLSNYDDPTNRQINSERHDVEKKVRVTNPDTLIEVISDFPLLLGDRQVVAFCDQLSERQDMLETRDEERAEFVLGGDGEYDKVHEESYCSSPLVGQM